jgi:predicted nucleic acid-binding protein
MDEHGTPVNASSLIYLAKANALRVAAEYLGTLLVPPAVWREAVEAGEKRGRPDAAAIRIALEHGVVRHTPLVQKESERAERIARAFGIGAGESQVLTLGAEREVVLLDEHKATRAAGHLGILSIRTIVLPALCAQAGLLDRAGALALLDELSRHMTIPTESWVRARTLIMETPG